MDDAGHGTGGHSVGWGQLLVEVVALVAGGGGSTGCWWRW